MKSEQIRRGIVSGAAPMDEILTQVEGGGGGGNSQTTFKNLFVKMTHLCVSKKSDKMSQEEYLKVIKKYWKKQEKKKK